MKGALLGRVSRAPAQPWTQAYSGSRDQIASQIRQVGGNKLGITFLFRFFNLMSMLCWSIVDFRLIQL